MNVFISHAHEEQSLAGALKDLLVALAPRTLKVWYSSDSDPMGGVGVGPWRKKLGSELKKSDLVLALCTPESAPKPWLMFECATAMSGKTARKVIPVLYYMNEEGLPSPLADLQCYQGDAQQGVTALCAKVLKKKLAAPQLKHVQEYLARVALNTQERDGRPFLQDQFHAFGTADKLKGKWFAKWTKQDASGVEQEWLQDTLELTTTKLRLAAVGTTKRGFHYPMEGIVSSLGYIAFVYWSRDSIPICGTVLLKVISGSFLEGTWQGHDGSAVDELERIEGCVALGRDEARVTRWFPSAK